MIHRKDKDADNLIAFISSSGLRGRQSVRATFKLSSGCIAAISIVAAQLGIKQKSLFDHLAQDSDSLNAIAREVQNARLRAENRIQKTYVISRKSLRNSSTGRCVHRMDEPAASIPGLLGVR